MLHMYIYINSLYTSWKKSVLLTGQIKMKSFVFYHFLTDVVEITNKVINSPPVSYLLAKLQILGTKKLIKPNARNVYIQQLIMHKNSSLMELYWQWVLNDWSNHSTEHRIMAHRCLYNVHIKQWQVRSQET